VRPIENAGAMSWRDCKRDGLLPRIDFEMTGTEQSWPDFPHNRWLSLLGEGVDSAESQFKRWLRGNNTLRRLCEVT
jgi:hypothetical protein